MKSTLHAWTLAGLLVSILGPRAAWPVGLPGPGPAFATIAESLAVMESAGQWRKADSLATAALERLDREPVLDSLSLAWMLIRHSNYRRILGQTRSGVPLAAAERALEINLRLRPFDSRVQALGHSSAALVYIEMGRGDSALAHAGRGEQALRAAAPVDDSLLVILLLRKARAQSMLQNHAAAVATLEDARSLAVRSLSPGAADLGLVCADLGYSLVVLGEFDRARTEYECALRIGERHRHRFPIRLESAIQGLAILERRSGNRMRGVELSAQAHDLYLAREGANGPQASVFAASLANALIGIGDFPRARGLLEEVVAKQAVQYPPTHAGVLQNRLTLASACQGLGDLATARSMLDTIDSILATGGPEQRINVSYSTSIRTSIDLVEGRYAEVRRRLLATAAAGSVDFGLRSDLAALLYRTVTGPEERALADSLGRALDAWADTAAAEETVNWTAVLMQRAAAEGRLGQHGPAWAHALQAESLATRRFRHEVEALPDRAALLFDEEESSPADVLIELARPERSDEVRRAWEAVLARRGAVLDRVAARRPLAGGADTALVGAHARWVAASRRHAQLVVSGAFDDGGPEGAAKLESSRAAAERAEHVYARLAAAAGLVRNRVTLDGVLGRLDPLEALVAYVGTGIEIGDEKLYALVAPPGGRPPVLVRLGALAPIVERVRTWTELLAIPPPVALRDARRAESAVVTAGEALRKSVWDPLLPLIGDATRVSIVAAGPLLDLPWLALPLSGGRYLAEGDLRIRVHAAERDLLKQDEHHATGLLAVGDPDFDRRGKSAALASRFTLRGLPGGCDPILNALVPLPGARREAQTIAQRWSEDAAGGRAEVLTGSEATEERFKQLAPGRRVIHLATHGVLTRDSCTILGLATRGVGSLVKVGSGGGTSRPSRPSTAAAAPAIEPPRSPWAGRETWLAFAGANHAREGAADENEGWLTADEVVTLDLRGNRRVVLSACQSGAGGRWTREAVSGMRRAFHLAGSRCVLASRWPIADESTRALMEAFYASNAAPAGVALQDACRAVIAERRSRGATTHPFFWGAFTVTGD